MSIKPFMVGIAGGSCSGKTSIAACLSGLLGGRMLVLGLDSYYHDFTGVPEEDIEVDIPGALDEPLLVEQLQMLADGRSIEKPVYDYATHSREAMGSWIEPNEYVVVEGLFVLYWPEMRDLFGLRVFVTVDHDTALARRLERDVCERGRSKASVRAQYRDKVRPNYERYVSPTGEFADLLVDGLAPVEESAAAIYERLKSGK